MSIVKHSFFPITFLKGFKTIFASDSFKCREMFSYKSKNKGHNVIFVSCFQ